MDARVTDPSSTAQPWGRVVGHVRVVSLCTLASRIMGLLRDSLMAAMFGNGPILDAFTIAFRIPNLARSLIGEGVLATAFLPRFLEARRESVAGANRLLTALGQWLIRQVGAAVLLLAAVLLIVSAVAPVSPETRLLCSLSGLLLPFLVLICLSAQLAAALQACEQFLVPALVPALLNCVWLAGIVLVGWWLTDEWLQIHLICLIVLLGGVIQIVVSWLTARHYEIEYRHDWPLAAADVRVLLGQMWPILLGLLVTQLNALADSGIAWLLARPESGGSLIPGLGIEYPLEPGTASALYLGQRLFQFPLGVFGVALSGVLYPRFTRHAQDEDWGSLRQDLLQGMQLVTAIAIPAGIGLMLIAGPLARLFFQYGRFNADDAAQTAAMIQAYGSGVWGFCSLLLLQRAFYALGDRWTPLRIGLWCIAANLILNALLIWSLKGTALAWSTAAIATLQSCVMAAVLQRQTGRWPWQELRRTFAQTMVCVAAMVVVFLMVDGLIARSLLAGSRLAAVGGPLLSSVVAYLALASVIGFGEPWYLLTHRSRESIPVGSQPPPLE